MPGTLNAQLNQEGLSTSRATVRQHSVYVDRPLGKGALEGDKPLWRSVKRAAH